MTRTTLPMHRPALVDLALAGCVALLAILFNLDEMRAHAFFFADDWAWLHYAEFRPYADLFTVLPTQVYNDRPVGAVLIKWLYSRVGIDIHAFHAMQFALHAANGVLLYFITRPHASRTGAAIAALLAVTWMSANEAVFWTAAIFDLLGATLCLLTILVRNASARAGDRLFLDLAGAFVLFLAIRTKEFALGVPVLLLAWSLLLHGRTPMQALRATWPYLAVMLLVGLKYAQLLSVDSSLVNNSTQPYGLHADGVLKTTGFYVSRLFYVEVSGPAGLALVLIAIAVAFLVGRSRWREAVVGMIGFLVLLGPVLLIPNQLNALYLYAPHFMVAFAIGCLVSPDNRSGMPFALLLACLLVLVPVGSIWHKSVVNFNRIKQEPLAVQYESMRDIARRIPKGGNVYVAGVEPYFNTFANGPGKALMILTHDESLKVIVEKPDAELQAGFCQSPPPRFFIEYKDGRMRDTSESRAALCPH